MMSILYNMFTASAKFFSLGTGVVFALNVLRSQEFSDSTTQQIETIVNKVIQKEKFPFLKLCFQTSTEVISSCLECIQTYPKVFIGIGLVSYVVYIASSFVYYARHTYESLVNGTLNILSTSSNKCFDFLFPYWSKMKSYFSSSSEQRNVVGNICEVSSINHEMLPNGVLAKSDLANILSSLNKIFKVMHKNNEVVSTDVKNSIGSLQEVFQDLSNKLSKLEAEQHDMNMYLSAQTSKLRDHGVLPPDTDPMSDPLNMDKFPKVFGDSVAEDGLNTPSGFPTLPSSRDLANSVLEVFEWSCFLETLLPLLYLFILYTFFRSILKYCMKK